MPVRSTDSSRTALADILTALAPLSNVATEASVKNVLENSDEILLELKKVRTGHELHLWGNDVNEVREE